MERGEELKDLLIQKSDPTKDDFGLLDSSVYKDINKEHGF